MNNNDLKRAKQIFFECDGSLFYMSRNSLEDEYNNYGIDDKIEKQWENELIKLRLSEYKKTCEFIKLHTLIEYSKYELLEEILNVKIRGPYINQLVVLEYLIDFLKKKKWKFRKELFKLGNEKIKTQLDILKLKKVPIKIQGWEIQSRLKDIEKKLVKM